MSPDCLNRSSLLSKPIASSTGDGIMSLAGSKWAERRKNLNPTFKQNVLLSFLPIFNAESKNLVAFLDSLVGQGEKKVQDDIVRWSFRIATQTTVGTDVKQEAAFKNDSVLRSFETLMKIIVMNVVLPFTHNKLISTLSGFQMEKASAQTKINKMIGTIVDNKLVSKPKSDSHPEFSSVINKTLELHRNGEMSVDEVRSECGSMVAAAFETTGVTVFHALTLLAMFPEHQDTIYQELKELFPMAGDFEVTYDDLQRMVYLERVLSEALRLIPSVPFTPRETTQDFRLSTGVVIPKGLTIAVDIFATHRNRDHWGPNPSMFNPDHFLPDNVRDRHPYAYIPFSKGRRNCIGWKYGLMSSKLALSKILRNYKVSTSYRYEDLEFVDNMGMKLAQSPGLDEKYFVKMIVMQLLIAASIILWSLFLWSRRKLYLLILQLPGTMGLPLIGNSIRYLIIGKRNMSIRTRYMDRYGSTYLSWIGTTPILITRDPKIAEEVFTSPLCINRSSQTTNAMALSMGNGLLTLQGSKWLARRKQMNPAFKHSILVSFLPIFNAETDLLVSFFGSNVSKGEVDVLPDLIRWSFKIATQTTLGTDVTKDASFKDDTILKSYQSILRHTIINIFLPFVQNKIVSKLFGLERMRARDVSEINKMINNVLDKKMNSSNANNCESELRTVLHWALELFRNDEISLMELRAECSSMVLAAFETSAHTVYHALVLLAMFPEHQEMVFNEIKEHFPLAKHFEVTHTDLQQLVYLDRVLNETLRLMPSVPISARETLQDFPLSNGVVIPKGMLIVVDIFNTHRNSDYWGSEAAQFKPENFLPKKIQDRHPYAFVPFSKGKRNCIGWQYGLMSSKLALVKILRNYQLRTSFPYENLEFVDHMVMKMNQSPQLAFQRRTS
ncbi:probable cytochrome P450 313a2 [Drosophila santomea]|uniref:probable cytochrome P450 313a2 n=1 Tax=Drosophila santomea TaxID=129105 RepID=UPI0019537D7B|nr:probable cytochrome P450 313a2 [Drosophila santomea]